MYLSTMIPTNNIPEFCALFQCCKWKYLRFDLNDLFYVNLMPTLGGY